MYKRQGQIERFICNATYQQAKLHFIEDELEPGAAPTADQNRLAYLRFKEWERENGNLVWYLKRQ